MNAKYEEESPIKIIRDRREELGSCSFCDNDYYRFVYELSGLQTSIRICRKCLRKVKKETR